NQRRGGHAGPPLRRMRLGQAPYLLPHALICVPYVISIFMARGQSLRFHNQSFVMSAPFWVTWTNSYGRMLWFWGFSATISMFLWSRSGRDEGGPKRIADCELRIADLLSPRMLLLLRRILRETGRRLSIRDPQSAISDPQSSILDLRSSILVSF